MVRTIDEVGERLGAANVARHGEIRTLLTDSRELEDPEGTLFFAIRTKGNDGHRYIGDLYRRGVRSFVVERVPEEFRDATDVNFIVVDDVVGALQKLTARDASFQGTLLAITGSRGKTTLKEWIFQLMEPLADVSRSPRSFNSQIGVPLSMWGLSESAALGIVEAGISRTGEMQALADVIRPDVVIITNVSDPHSEGFADDAEKAREKCLLASRQETGTVIYCRDYKLISDALDQTAPGKQQFTWSYTDPEADVYIVKGETKDGLIHLTYRYKGEEHELEAPLTSDADFENAANALTFMLYSGVDAQEIARNFKDLHKLGTRLNVSDGVNGCILIHDQYTSDFSSLRPALHFARRRQTPGSGLTLILSDLHHETSDTDTLYRQVSRLVKSAGVSRFVGIGPKLAAHRELFGDNAECYESLAQFTASRSGSDFNNETILLKGSPEAGFEEIEEMLEARRHETVLEVNLDAIVSNFNQFRRHLQKGTGIVCMVKASGYGAGSYEIAKTLQDAGAAYLAVAVLDEGVELRDKGITMPVMVMNPRVANYKSMFANRLEPEIYSFGMLEDVIREARKNGVSGYPIHIKLDTGMHRMGFIGDELPELMRRLEGVEEVKVRSVFTHLCVADCPDQEEYTQLQLKRYAEWSQYIVDHTDGRVLRHVLNTAGILRYPEHHYDMARLGIGLYGVMPLEMPEEKPLAVVSTLRTVICAIHEWKAGETVGYGRWGVLKRDSRIATIAIGYADGMNRHFGRGAVNVIVNGKEAPTVGNICMDACMIDVTDIDCKVGDAVEIFGRQAPVERLADVLDTIPYEILTSVSPRVKRVYYRE